MTVSLANMDTGALTREQIIAAYQTLLGRDPESSDTIEYHLANSRNLEEFRQKVLISAEFQSKYAAFIESNYSSEKHKAKIIGFDESEVSGLAFQDFFERLVAPRLKHRAETFRAAYRHLLAHRPSNMTVLETGCLRSAGNWAGDGQSTLQFEHLVRRCGGHVISMDLSPVSIAIAHYFCPTVQLVLSDSVKYLNFLSEHASGMSVDLLYLDSLDIDPDDPLRSAEHHLRELSAAWPLLHKGSLVFIDDHNCPTERGSLSKSTLANEWLADRGAIKIAEAYQIVWAVP